MNWTHKEQNQQVESTIWIQGYEFKNVVCKIATILCQSQSVKKNSSLQEKVPVSMANPKEGEEFFKAFIRSRDFTQIIDNFKELCATYRAKPQGPHAIYNCLKSHLESTDAVALFKLLHKRMQQPPYDEGKACLGYTVGTPGHVTGCTPKTSVRLTPLWCIWTTINWNLASFLNAIYVDKAVKCKKKKKKKKND